LATNSRLTNAKPTTAKYFKTGIARTPHTLANPFRLDMFRDCEMTTRRDVSAALSRLVPVTASTRFGIVL
jgi:hypothetical protein